MNPDIRRTLDYCREFTEELLEDDNEFNPFAVFIDQEGELQPLEYEGNSKENPLSGHVIEVLTKKCEQEFEKWNIVSYAIVYEVKMQLDPDSPPIDAIAVDIKHNTETEIPIYYFQYLLKDEEIKFSEIFAVKRTPEV